MTELWQLVALTVVVSAAPFLSRYAFDMDSRSGRWLYRTAMLDVAFIAYVLSSMWLRWAGCRPAWLYPMIKD